MDTSNPSQSSKILHAALLVAILLAGFTLRVWNLNFDDGLMTHPDERSTVCFIAPSIGWPNSIDELRDPNRSPLNPMWNRSEQRPTNYTYGHFPLYMGKLTGEVFHQLAPLAQSVGVSEQVVELMSRANQPCGGIAVAGRFMIALLDTLTIWLIYLLGRRTFGSATGLVAAAFYAFSAQAIQLSHFFAMDPASTTFTVLAVLGGVKMVQERTLGAAVLTGLGAGLAVGSKFSALPVMAVPVTAVILWMVTSPREATSQVARSQARALAALVIAFVVMALTFFISSPYAILDWSRFVKATLVDQGQMVRGVADFPFTRQFRNTLPYIYFIRQQVEWGLGWPLGILSLLGTLVAAGALVRTLFRLASAWIRGVLSHLDLGKTELANVVIWSWVAPYFGITGAFLAKFNRYMSPILPFAVLFAAGLLWLLWRWGSNRLESDSSKQSWVGRLPQIASGLIGALVMAGALFWSLSYVNGVYGREHTWITASRWIYENVPRGSILLWELWDDALPKSIPGEPGMDMGSMGLTNIDWSPYEEDTAEKFLILKQKLTEADYVVYSSKRIYDSVDELPERYPMTNLYYDAMWDGRLGFEVAADISSPPQLLGITFQDRDADESWTLYDHPQVTIFRKVRQLSDAEFDSLFNRNWESAVPYYRGKDSPISTLLQIMGLGSQPGSEGRGLIGMVVGLLDGQDDSAIPTTPQTRSTLLFDEPLANLPVVDNYRWNQWASEQPFVAALIWWLVIVALGLAAFPISFVLFTRWLDRGYLFSRTLGWLLAGWLLWIFASAGVLYNTVVNSWLMAGVLLIIGMFLGWKQRHALREFFAERWKLLLVEEVLFIVAFALFIFIRMANPDLWQPWFGGEKFMEFAFLNGVLRSPTFPPVDPHFAGGYINYYYFGIYLVGYLIKLTGIYAEVAFNLTIPMLFALTVCNAFAITHTAWALWRNSTRWHHGVLTALLGPFFLVLLGNLEGYAQIVRQLSERSPLQLQSVLPGVPGLIEGFAGLWQVATGKMPLPMYDFWGPSRVIPATINEFPYWSFLFADLHPHLIGIPLSVLFVGILFGVAIQYGEVWRGSYRRGIALTLGLAFVLGALISVNLWELPTYLGLAILTLLMSEYRSFGRIHFVRVGLLTSALLLGAIIFYLPFFLNFVNVGASGIGLVRAGDEMGLWLLLWGGLGFIVVSWLIWTARNGGLVSTSYRQQKAISSVLDSSANVETQVAQDKFVDAEVTMTEVIEGQYHAEAEAYEVREIEMVAEAEDFDLAPDQRLDYVTNLELQESASLKERNVQARSGVARVLGMSMRHFERLPRLWYLHRMLVEQPTLSYLLGVAAIPTLLILAIVVWALGRGVLGLCLIVLSISLPLLWRREREADDGDQLTTMLAVTGVAILAGTQVFFLKDFLQGDAYYRMNTLFKFFNHVWVLWALAAAIALPRLWSAARGRKSDPVESMMPSQVIPSQEAEQIEERKGMEDWIPERNLSHTFGSGRVWRVLWQTVCVALLVACSVYLVAGTASRLSQRFVGWVPPFGTLNGLAFMEQGRYSWPNEGNVINLSYDWQAIQWLLEHVRGNAVIAESSEVDYYRAGGTRVASMTGLSGLRGAHVSEQRYGDQVGARDGLHREFWSTPDVARTEELIRQLQIAMIYVGQLEQYQHPDGVQKLAKMASEGRLDVLYQNDGVIIYSVPGQLTLTEDGWYVPVPQDVAFPLPSMGTNLDLDAPSLQPIPGHS